MTKPAADIDVLVKLVHLYRWDRRLVALKRNANIRLMVWLRRMYRICVCVVLRCERVLST